MGSAPTAFLLDAFRAPCQGRSEKWTLGYIEIWCWPPVGTAAMRAGHTGLRLREWTYGFWPDVDGFEENAASPVPGKESLRENNLHRGKLAPLIGGWYGILTRETMSESADAFLFDTPYAHSSELYSEPGEGFVEGPDLPTPRDRIARRLWRRIALRRGCLTPGYANRSNDQSSFALSWTSWFCRPRPRTECSLWASRSSKASVRGHGWRRRPNDGGEYGDSERCVSLGHGWPG